MRHTVINITIININLFFSQVQEWLEQHFSEDTIISVNGEQTSLAMNSVIERGVKSVAVKSVKSDQKEEKGPKRTGLTLVPISRLLKPENRAPNGESNTNTYAFICSDCMIIMTDRRDVLRHMASECMDKVRRFSIKLIMNFYIQY